ncbi:MAG: hypothetical protein BWY63_03303 [Chloroflexi bacterium ADurb.Bin360]|nr:MAG: hypothetical protein BWY63_03303 [Chloroflexi bacterium ADurb.Bin360]
MLEIVQHQQQFFTAELVQQKSGRILGRNRQVERISNGQSHQVAMGHGCQCDKSHPVSKETALLLRHLQRQTALTNAAGSGEGNQAAVGISKHLSQLRPFSFSP